METTYLKEYLVLADCRSFTEAARQLHITQSTLSKHVAAMEREFDCCLFVREKQGVRMTSDGRVLLARAKEALHALDCARLEMKGTQIPSGPHMDTTVQAPSAALKRQCARVGEAYGLTPGETGALILYLSGRSIDEIGIELGKSRDTAAQLLGSSYRKLGVSSKEQALALMYSDSE